MNSAAAPAAGVNPLLTPASVRFEIPAPDGSSGG